VRHGVRHLAGLRGLALKDSDDQPDPIWDALAVQLRMPDEQLREDQPV
jgi:hypothetical protein